MFETRTNKSLAFFVLLLLGGIPSVYAQQVECKPFHETGIYELGERVGWTVSLAPGAAAPSAPYTYVIRKNNLDVLRQGALDLSAGPATLEAGLGVPAMLYVELRSPDPAAKPNVIHLGAAVAPDKLQPSAPRPADFDAFWDAKLKALAEIPINPVLTPVTDAPPGVEQFTFRLDSLGSHVQGYLAKPAKEGKFPALVHYQYAGVYALRPELSTHFAADGWLVLNVSSHDLAPTQATGVSKEYYAIGNGDRETSYFLNMYLRDVRAIDYLTTRPDWDGRTIVVMGTSMAGHQSLVAAALHPRVTAVLVNEPSGANSNGPLHGYQAGFPDWLPHEPKVLETGLYFDTVNFASRIKAPVLAAVGFIDTIVPPAGVWIVFNQIRGPKEMISMVESDHNNLTPQKQGAWDIRHKEALAQILTSGTFVPAANSPSKVP